MSPWFPYLCPGQNTLVHAGVTSPSPTLHLERRTGVRGGVNRCPGVLPPCPQEIKARRTLSEQRSSLAHSRWGKRWNEQAHPTPGASQRLGGDVHARARAHLFADVQTGERSRGDAVSSVATLLSHSWPVFTYLFGATAAMTGATHSQEASRAPRRPFKQRR